MEYDFLCGGHYCGGDILLLLSQYRRIDFLEGVDDHSDKNKCQFRGRGKTGHPRSEPLFCQGSVNVGVCGLFATKLHRDSFHIVFSRFEKKKKKIVNNFENQQ
jgi:hypothetical protein